MPHIKAFSEKNKIKPNLLHFLFFYDTMFSNKEDGFSLFERERKIKTGEKKMGAIEKAETLFLWFMIYSVVGWIYESILCSVAQKKFINRGFLNGPYCPIYGSGAVLVILVLGKLTNPFLLFFAGALLTCSLEYLTSFVMEKLFHARWWDYSKRKFNINGRVCLIGAVVFGAFSTVLVLWIHPLVTKLTDMLSPLARHIVSAVLFCGLVTDLVFTVQGMAGFREKIEEVSELVEQQKKALEEKIHDSEAAAKLRGRRTEIKKKFTLQQRRLISAFPSLKFKKPQSNETLRSLRDVMKKIKEKKER